jgi:hypothetical protein
MTDGFKGEGGMKDNTLVQPSFLGEYQRSHRESGYSLSVLYPTRVGIPILLPSSLLRRCNHDA